VNQDFRELLAVFNEEKVKYLIIGGYAVIKHAEPRYTKDLDLWVSTNETNPENVFRALKRFGAPLSKLSPTDFASAGFFYTMGIDPQRVDILFDLTELDFDACWERRVSSEVEGVVVHFISVEDLIFNKEKVGRLQDLADAEKLRYALDEEKKRKNT
jgi:predicted nucleotidyltransferase